MGDLPPDLDTPCWSSLSQPSEHQRSITIDDFPSSFSFSQYISSPTLLTPSLLPASNIHPTHLVTLSLNEECRIWGYGRVIHLPLTPATASSRTYSHRQRGHPTDLVYTPTIWSEGMKREWDGGSWGKRLKVCCAGKCVCVFSFGFVLLEACKLVPTCEVCRNCKEDHAQLILSVPMCR
jgi:hypothetical protein